MVISLAKTILSHYGNGDRFLNRFIFFLWGMMIFVLGCSVTNLIGIDHIVLSISIVDLRVQYDDKFYNEWWWFLVSFHTSLVISILDMVSNNGCVLTITALLWEETPWKPPRKRQWSKVEDASSLLYGDICTIIENWQSEILFLTTESIYWVLNRRIFIDITRKLANVIQQEELVFGSLTKWVIANDEDCTRLNANM
ncbi:unnamed protein product [Arabis nemorensis]|uniref:Uncharacterized protein n=1 Tax=Arabis nemorensis TaxID=586526 RepID=A0A565BBZ0_9BRAS|nr:unnamed protein product [Arabis nemorensis]